MFSLLVARLLTPMMAAYLLKPHGEEKRESRLMRWYLRRVDAALRPRGRTLWIATGLFFASLAIVPLIPTPFIPTPALGRRHPTLTLPPGTTRTETPADSAAARAPRSGIPHPNNASTP